MMRPRHRPYRSPGGPGLAVASTLTFGVGGLALAAVAVAAAVAYTSMTHKQRRRAGVSRQQWEAALSELGQVVGFDAIVHEASQRGLEPEVRADAWPFLLGVFAADTTYEERRQQHGLMVAQYQQLLQQCQALEAALRDCMRQQRDAAAGGGADGGAAAAAAFEALQQQQLDAIQQQQQAAAAAAGGDAPPAAAAAAAASEMPAQVAQFAEAHRIIVLDAVRTDFRRTSVAAIYSSAAAASAAGGVSFEDAVGAPPGAGSTLFGPPAAATLPPHLPDDPLVASWVSGWMGGPRPASPWGADARQRHPHHAPPGQRLWVSEAAQHVLANSSHLNAEGHQQAARLISLLSAYAVYDPETGYCQGMSDLATPLLVLFDDDALAFWCFAALMRTFGARGNFAVDESGIFSQLRALSGVLGRSDRVLAHKLQAMGAGDCHFAYRMVVVLMRRDLPLAQVMTLWEVLWADARRQLLQRQRKRADAAALLPPLIAAAPPAGGAGNEDDPKVILRRVGGGADNAAPPGDDDEATGGFLAASCADLFVHFVAAVVVGSRRRVLDECTDQDDAMRLFHTLKGIDFWECVTRAQVLRAASIGRKHK